MALYWSFTPQNVFRGLTAAYPSLAAEQAHDWVHPRPCGAGGGLPGGSPFLVMCQQLLLPLSFVEKRRPSKRGSVKRGKCCAADDPLLSLSSTFSSQLLLPFLIFLGKHVEVASKRTEVCAPPICSCTERLAITSSYGKVFHTNYMLDEEIFSVCPHSSNTQF